MKKFENFGEVYKSLENDPEYLVEKLSIDFITELNQLMQERGLTKKDLAKIMGTSQAYITKIFNRTYKLNLSSMAKFVLAVDGKIDVRVTKK